MDEERFASPDQRRAFEELQGVYGDRCNRCRRRGHWQAECPERWHAMGMRCFECGGDHAHSNCPVAAAREEEERRVAVAQEEEERREASINVQRVYRGFLVRRYPLTRRRLRSLLQMANDE